MGNSAKKRMFLVLMNDRERPENVPQYQRGRNRELNTGKRTDEEKI